MDYRRLIHPSGAYNVDLDARPRRPIVCRACKTQITDMDYLLSRSFVGFAGKAALFGDTVTSPENTPLPLKSPLTQLMATGAHIVQELTCPGHNCGQYLGMKVVRAHEWSEKWKEGKWILELEYLTGWEMWDESRLTSHALASRIVKSRRRTASVSTGDNGPVMRRRMGSMKAI